MESHDKTLTAMCDLIDETGADFLKWKITTVDGKVITICITNREDVEPED